MAAKEPIITKPAAAEKEGPVHFHEARGVGRRGEECTYYSLPDGPEAPPHPVDEDVFDSDDQSGDEVESDGDITHYVPGEVQDGTMVFPGVSALNDTGAWEVDDGDEE